MAKRTTPHKVAFVSLGCAKNLVDSEKLLAQVGSAGCIICERPQDADVLIINTCAFIEEATQESLDIIREAAQLKKAGMLNEIIVTGCLAQRFGSKLRDEIEQIDHVVPLGHFEQVVHLCAGRYSPMEPTARLRLTPRCFAYLKISEGCDNRCNYCTIPSIRGPLRSRPLDELVAEARQLVEDGAREINVIAQDTASYAVDTTGRCLLPELVHALSDIQPLRWIRLLYMHPAHVTDQLIQLISRSEKVCNYVDLPLQHINDKLLGLMARRITRAQIEGLIQRIRNEIRGVFIRTSIIVGFPGETEGDFEELLDFVQQVRFERLGAFIYSREEGTAAAELPHQVATEIKKDRFDRLMRQQQEIARELNRKMHGKQLEVMLEVPSKEKRGRWEGRAYTDAPEVDGKVFVSGRNLENGQFHLVEITGATEYDLVGKSVAQVD